ncbi:MAG: hypothetical protein ABIP03_03680 [Aquihabitans sp.]
MGFLDKVKTQAEQTLKQGQERMDDMQAKKKADGLLRDLGAWYYATQTGRDSGQGATEIARIGAELQAHEAEHGPLTGGEPEPEASAPPPTSPAPTSPPPTSPPPTSPPPPPGAAPAPPAPPTPPGSF